jgi:hypothetical protein
VLSSLRDIDKEVQRAIKRIEAAQRDWERHTGPVVVLPGAEEAGWGEPL